MEKGTIIRGPTKKQILGAAKWYQVALASKGSPTSCKLLRWLRAPCSLSSANPLVSEAYSLADVCVTARQELRALSLSLMVPWIPATFFLQQAQPEHAETQGQHSAAWPGLFSMAELIALPGYPFSPSLEDIHGLDIVQVPLEKAGQLASPWEADLLKASTVCWYASKNSLEGIQPRSPQQCQPGYKEEPRTRKIFCSFSLSFYFSSLSPMILDFLG